MGSMTCFPSVFEGLNIPPGAQYLGIVVLIIISVIIAFEIWGFMGIVFNIVYIIYLSPEPEIMFRLYDSYTTTDKRKLRELKERRQKFYDELVADAKKMGVIMSSP